MISQSRHVSTCRDMMAPHPGRSGARHWDPSRWLRSTRSWWLCGVKLRFFPSQQMENMAHDRFKSRTWWRLTWIHRNLTIWNNGKNKGASCHAGKGHLVPLFFLVFYSKIERMEVNLVIHQPMPTYCRLEFHKLTSTKSSASRCILAPENFQWPMLMSKISYMLHFSWSAVFPAIA